jgi:hypothetical protein
MPILHRLTLFEEKIMRLSSIRFQTAVVILALALCACTPTAIRDITADPGSYKNKEVTVVGEVTQSVGASIGSFNKGVYEISDGTGNLWVYSESRGIPSRGAHVGVKGRIAQAVTIMGRNYATVLQESDRRLEKPGR